jgi:dipeptidase E
VRRHAPGGRGLYVPTAGEALREEPFVAETRDAFAAVLSSLREVWLADGDDPGLLEEVDVVVLGPGDPFHLLDRLHATGWDTAIARAVGRGLPYVGLSAGAMVAGPSLEPIQRTSPFTPRAGLDWKGLGLVDFVPLPHDDRPGRARRHAEAQSAFGGRFHLRPITDTRALWVEEGRIRQIDS